MTQSLHAIKWYLFIIWLPNLMRAMHVYLTSLNGVLVCVLCVLNTLYVVYHTSLNCLFLYTLSLFSRNFKPRLVMPKFQASVSVYRAAKLPPLQPAPCYPELFTINLCLVVLRQLPPSQPVSCYSKIKTRAKIPTSCEIPTREIPVVPMNRKNRLKSVGVLS